MSNGKKVRTEQCQSCGDDFTVYPLENPNQKLCDSCEFDDFDSGLMGEPVEDDFLDEDSEGYF